MQEIFDHFFDFTIPGPILMSYIIIGLLIVLCIVVFILAKRADPLKKPKGLLAIAEIAVEKVDGLVDENMGKSFPNFGAYVLAIALFIFTSFILGIVSSPNPLDGGHTSLGNPLTYLGVPLSLALCTFTMIHVTSIKYTKWSYFKRYVDPIPAFLPINLLSMWAPLLSLTLRLFGNAFAGWVLMSIVYWACGSLSNLIFANLAAGPGSIFIAPLVAPMLHAYFDVFSGAIQTLVFMFLSMLFVAQEKPEEIKAEERLALA
ncbi:MAG: F0F1 ATP synthase subunit A [Bacilli bacterium]|nr:F0F1 ATP synthase subunit A [Bacilli bacterium]